MDFDIEPLFPNAVDGFTTGQRKVIFTCFKRNDKMELKVTRLTGSVVVNSAYHYGMQRCNETIVNLAQDFVGSNNINLLMPNGMFGSRFHGGQDSGKPHHIYTMLSPVARLIFHPHDDPLLTYLQEDNQDIEPIWYIPIIPMLLVNGIEGTEWSTKIPHYNPRDLISNLRLLLQNKEPVEMKPYYKNFRGNIQCVAEHEYVCTGKINILPGNRIEITELPVGTWTETYEENVLKPLLHGSKKIKAIISGYKDYYTEINLRFVISFAAGEFEKLRSEPNGFYRVFKLTSSISASSIKAFDKNLSLRCFENETTILKEFFPLRLSFYEKRKNYLVGLMTAELEYLENQVRFLDEQCNGTFDLGMERKLINDELLNRGFKPNPIREWERLNNPKAEQEAKAEAKEGHMPDQFDYLLNMKIWMVMTEKKRELEGSKEAKRTELELLKGKTPEMLWIEDLDTLEAKLDEMEQKKRDKEEEWQAKWPHKTGTEPESECDEVCYMVSKMKLQ